jgi:oligopeptide/dipeptide ABC transporter ATP-binding protein
MVFQDPMSSLDPLMTIGDQVCETLRVHGTPRKAARAKALALLQELGVERAAERMDAYPHEFSGGMRQRVVLAMALIAEPRLLIADEPTTALDVRVQEQVLDMLDNVSRRRSLAVLLITHDLGIVAGFADRVMVMYSGRIVEDGPIERIFANPQHPYTRGLLAAVPRVDQTRVRLTSIPGTPPAPRARPSGCAFHPRCPSRLPVCDQVQPALAETFDGRLACHNPGPPA